MNTIASNIEINPIAKSRIESVDFDNIVFGKIYSDHMLEANYIDGEWVDAKIVPFENISLSPATSALHYGQVIFEGMKADVCEATGKVNLFRPIDNYNRFNISAERICMLEIPEEIFMGGLKELLSLDRNWIPSAPGCSLYIRPFMFATDEYIGLKPSQNYKFMIFTSPVGRYYSEPVKVKFETKYSRACHGGTGFAKFAGNYAGSMYPAKLAQAEGYDQLIWTDANEHKYIEEAGTMNLMFVIDGKLYTPATGDTILKGITRDSVLTLIRDWGYEVNEAPISVDTILSAIKDGTLTEAFGVGTAATITQVATIGHEGQNFDLPSVENGIISNRVLKELTAIKKGLQEDTHDWVVKL